jgi:hypothetical protein
LEYDPQALAKGGWRVMATMCTAEDDLTLRRFKRSSEASQKTGFSCSGRTNNGDELSTRHLESIPRNNHRPRLSKPNPRRVTCSEGSITRCRVCRARQILSASQVCGGVHLHQARSEDPIAQFRVFVVHGKQRGAQSRPIRIRNR